MRYGAGNANVAGAVALRQAVASTLRGTTITNPEHWDAATMPSTPQMTNSAGIEFSKSGPVG